MRRDIIVPKQNVTCCMYVKSKMTGSVPIFAVHARETSLSVREEIHYSIIRTAKYYWVLVQMNDYGRKPISEYGPTPVVCIGR